MWKNPGEGSVPSGFYSPSTAPNARAAAARPGAPTGTQQPSGYYQNYAHSSGYNPYGAAPLAMNYGTAYSTTTATLSQVAPPANARKRPRSESSCRCEACDLELDSLKALESHKKSHVRCNVCGFEGAPKVVKGHYQAVHGKFSGSGFKTVTVQVPGCPVQRFKICVGNRPEDVQKWIEERKKKFPRSRPLPSKADKSEETKGLSTLLEGYSSSEDENEAKDAETKPAADPLVETQKPADIIATSNKKPCHSFVKHGRCRRGDACPYSHNPSLRRPKQGRKPTATKKDLLSSLLEADADREAKFTLQLIHYLVHSDFLKKRV